MTQTICYCHGYSDADLEEDIRRHGRSTIMGRIIAESKAVNCNCAHNNPKGRQCFNDVRRVVNTT